MGTGTIRAEVATIPTRRIVRYALYALVVVAAGWITIAVINFVVGLGVAALSLVLDAVSLVELHRATRRSVTESIRLFSYLVAAGVFLSQFERGN